MIPDFPIFVKHSTQLQAYSSVFISGPVNLIQSSVLQTLLVQLLLSLSYLSVLVASMVKLIFLPGYTDSHQKSRQFGSMRQKD